MRDPSRAEDPEMIFKRTLIHATIDLAEGVVLLSCPVCDSLIFKLKLAP